MTSRSLQRLVKLVVIRLGYMELSFIYLPRYELKVYYIY